MTSLPSLSAITAQFPARVARGVEALDRHFGTPDWRQRVDLGSLDQRSPLHDVLSQVLGSPAAHAVILQLDGEAAAQHGFDLTSADVRAVWGHTRATGKLYRALTEVWRQALTKPSTGLQLTVAPNGVVSLWDSPTEALRGAQPGEVYRVLALTPAQQQLITPSQEARS